MENEDEPSEVVDNTESESEEIEQKTNSTLVVKVPFTDVFKIWQSDLITIKKVIRGFGEDGECKLISFEKLDDVVIREGDLIDGVNMKELELHIPVDSNTEYVVEFNTGSLLTYKKVLSESLLATNSGNIELHFAINVETGKFDLYDGVELLADCPDWWLPKLDSENTGGEPVEPETPSEGEVTDPEIPSGEETDTPVEEEDTTETKNPSDKEEESQPSSPDTELEPNEDGTTV